MTSSEDAFVSKLDSLVEENLTNPSFSVEMICREMGISRAQLHRIMTERFGLSTTLYIRKLRLKKAHRLVAETDLRVSEIADRVGINNPQNFSKYFTQEFSISPTEFRRLQQVQIQEIIPGEAETRPLLHANVPPALVTPVPTRPSGPKQTTTRRERATRWMLYGLALAGLTLGLGVYLRTYIQPAHRPTDTVKASLAVLPLINMGPPDTNPVCEGLMDDIHTSISLIRHLRVTARSSSDQYRGSQKNMWQISEDMRVTHILRGKVLQTSNKVQVKMELINAREDRLIWSKTYRVAYQDVFQLTDQITQDVARELDLENNPTSADKLGLARTKNMVAYNAFLQGRQLVMSRTKENIVAGIIKFDHALSLDSTFAEAYAFKGVAYSVLANSDYTTDQAKMYALAQQNALKAIQIDPTNSTAHGVLGSIYADTYQWQAAESSFLIALQYNPNDAQNNYWYSLLLRSMGNLTEAIRYSTQAVALDPIHPVILSGHILNCAYANRFDLAQASLNSGKAIFNDSFIYYIGLGYFYLTQSQYTSAANSFSRGLKLNPNYTGQLPTLMYCEAKRGNRAKALAYLQTLAAKTPRTYYDKAVVFAGLAQKDSCLKNLKTAADLGHIYKDMKVVPVFRPYQSDPIFLAILRQYRYP